MKKYSRITEKERYLIEYGIRNGRSMRQIAKSIERPAKTIWLEIKRNKGIIGYYAAEAHYKSSKSNKIGYSKITKNKKLEGYIKEKLKLKWSPEVISGRWTKENPNSKISHETIYQWIYNQKDNLYLQLPRKKKKRGFKPSRNRSTIPDRISIHNRPEEINLRSELGHFEGDLIFQRGSKSQNILSMVERKSRLVVLKKNQSKKSHEVINNANKGLSALSAKSITFDNGSEFASHNQLKVETYFCDPGKPWQKGSIENVNGIVRRYLDYRIDINSVSQRDLDQIASLLNNKPRKILGFLTPIEFIKQSRVKLALPLMEAVSICN